MTVDLTLRGVCGLAIAASVMISAQVSAQEEACQSLDECIFEGCGGFEDTDCVARCLESSEDPEAARLFGVAVECINASDCESDDFDCLGEVCGDLFADVDDYCGVESDGESCDALSECLGECAGIDDSACIEACFENADSPEAVEVFEDLIGCMREAGCDGDDDDCLVDNCPDELESLGAICSFEEDARRCAQIEACVSRCPGLDDAECIGACVAEAEDQEAAEVFASTLACFVESGCDFEDEGCLVDACLDELTEFGEVCGFEDEEGDDDDFGNEPVDDCSENPGPDCCFLSKDGECDEPDFCDEGTDTTDCEAVDAPEPDAQEQDDSDPDEVEEGGGSGGGCATVPGGSSGLGWVWLVLGIRLLRRPRGD